MSRSKGRAVRRGVEGPTGRRRPRTHRWRLLAVLGGAVVALAAYAAISLGDTLNVNDLNTGGNTTLAPGVTGTADVFLSNNGNTPDDPVNGCNATGGTPATVQLQSDQTWLTLDQSSVQVVGCGADGKFVHVGYSVSTSAPSGAVATITGTASGGKDGSQYTGGSFTVTVSGSPTPPDSSAPVITISTGPADAEASSGWYNIASSGTDGVQVNVSAIDPSGVASLQCTDSGTSVLDATSDSGSFTLYDGIHSISCIATDTLGNSTAPGSQATASYKIDQTAPSVSADTTATRYTVGTDTWYADSVQFDWTATDGAVGSGIASGPTPASSSFGEGYGQSATAQATDVAGNTGTGNLSNVNVDASAPSVSASPTTASVYTNASGNWWKDSASFSVTASDPDLSDGHAGSGLAPTGDPSGTYGPYTSSGTFPAQTATDNVGHSTSSDPISYNVDSAAPTFGDCTGGPFILGGNGAVSITAQDEAGGSGLNTSASTLTGTVDTSTVGSKTVQFTAVDNVGHNPTKTCTYQVSYGWSGFLQPINDTAHFVGETTSVFKAGSTVPVKFQLTNASGAPVQEAAPGPVWLTPQKGGALPSSATVDESTYSTTDTPGGYYRWDSTGLQYIYNWNTAKSQAGFYWRIGVQLDDGNTYYVSIGLK